MRLGSSATTTATLGGSMQPLTGAPGDYDRLMDLVGDSRFVLLGEASHGTHEFYQARADITMRLIQEKGFNAVAVEADWPDAFRVNRFVRGIGDDATATEALGDFTRFPLWMWRNSAVLDFIGRLRTHNDQAGGEVGFYGLDLYSLHASMDAVVNYLQRVDPEAAARARHRYACFDHFGEDPQSYGYWTALKGSESCEDDVVEQLTELRARMIEYVRMDGSLPPDEHFYTEQNARLAVNAEAYYRSMFYGREMSWNLRDQHMTETLEALAEHLDMPGRPARIVVWEHNSHLGDARATDMHERGELNVGQLVRERHGEDVFAVGFTTYSGTVTAASDWGEPAERKNVRPALDGSYEDFFHRLSPSNFMVDLHHPESAALSDGRLERAIGVIYRPGTERVSHYFGANLPSQFDAVIHFDETHAVEPLERTPAWEAGEPETYPHGL